MHELSIAHSIVEIVEQQAKANNAKRILQIEIVVGELSGVEIYALEFALPVAVENTILANAEIKIVFSKGEACCLDCNKNYKLPNMYEPCPFCKSFLKNVVKGKELSVNKIEVEIK